jgi:glyoxylase-like metal-dependent hydrolase (beta-lactamase superfamily II)
MGPNEYEVGPLDIVAFELGPAMTNAYLVADSASGSAVVIDPAWDGAVILHEAEQRGWRITHIWLTHAHFDHFGGAGAISDAYDAPIPVALHAEDHSLWRMGGGETAFGIQGFDPGPEPTITIEDRMRLHLGDSVFEVRHTPGHTLGHVIFREKDLVFCGDLIFRGSVGRTDFPGGSMSTLLASIQDAVLSQPDHVQLFPGHGPPTTVGAERRLNPFLAGLDSETESTP